MDRLKFNLVESLTFNALYPTLVVLAIKNGNVSSSNLALLVSFMSAVSGMAALITPFLLGVRTLFLTIRGSLGLINILMSIFILYPNKKILILFPAVFLVFDKLTKFALKLKLDGDQDSGNLQILRENLRKRELIGILAGSLIAIFLIRVINYLPLRITFLAIFIYFLWLTKFIPIPAVSNSINKNYIFSRKSSQWNSNKQSNLLACLTSVSGLNIAVFEVAMPLIILEKMPDSLFMIPIVRILASLVVFNLLPRLRKISQTFEVVIKYFIYSIILQCAGFVLLFLAVRTDSKGLLIFATLSQATSGSLYVASQISFTTRFVPSEFDLSTQTIWSGSFALVILISGGIFMPAFHKSGNIILLLLASVSLLIAALLRFLAPRVFPKRAT